MNRILPVLSLFLTAALCNMALADDDKDPFEPFRGHDPASKYRIFYDDLNEMYKSLVVNVGRSTREVSEMSTAKTGTRMKQTSKRKTSNEGNRFYYEFFKKEEENRELLELMLRNYEAIPAEVPLSYFSRDEQLAYWINLYNLAMINEVVNVYPKSSLKKVVAGKKAVQKKKLLNVAGVPLSLDDIQYEILGPNYDNNPLIMYGLYQGIIGGPNIRKSAYTGANVWRNLANNAEEFVNSNRGTYPDNGSTFKVSSLYERNEVYFPNFDTDLKEHLLAYLEPPEKYELESASKLDPDIDDWSVTDLFGSHTRIGGSFADSSAALLDATSTQTIAGEGAGSIVAGPSFANALRIQEKSPVARYVSPELILQLQEFKLRQDESNRANATVTVEELGEVPVEEEPEPEPEPEPDDEGNG
jgi:hypothetical protein